MTTVVGRSANVVGRAAGNIWSYDKLPPVQLGMESIEPAASKCRFFFFRYRFVSRWGCPVRVSNWAPPLRHRLALLSGTLRSPVLISLCRRLCYSILNETRAVWVMLNHYLLSYVSRTERPTLILGLYCLRLMIALTSLKKLCSLSLRSWKEPHQLATRFDVKERV